MFGRRGRLWTIPLLLATLLAGVSWLRFPTICSSLYDLLGPAAERIPEFVRESSATEVSAVVSSASSASALAVARELQRMNAREDGVPAGALGFLREMRAGLVTEATAKLLATAEGRSVLFRRACRRLYASPVSPLLGFADDPFYLTEDFLKSLPAASGMLSSGSMPTLTTNGQTRVLVRLKLPSKIAGNVDATIAFVAQLRQRADELASHSVTVRLSGAPVHTAVSAGNCKSEIGWLTWFSVVVILLLSWLCFRSWRWIPLLAVSLATAALSGGLALVLAFREIHLMTLVFGTSVLGMVVDYSFHWLLGSGSDRRRIVRSLAISCLTTEISLVPLMVSSVPVLRQSAVFLGAGLLAAWLLVVFAYPDSQRPAISPKSEDFGLWRSGLGVALLLALALMVPGWRRLEVKTEMSALYRPPAELLQAERERLGFGTLDWSRLPSVTERRQRAELVRQLYAEHGEELSRLLALPKLTPPSGPIVELPSPQGIVETVLSDWTREALLRFAVALALMLAALFVLMRHRVWTTLAPSLAAVGLVIGILGWRGEALNLFHVPALFLLVGMGIDYSVFLHGGRRAALKPALCSLLTSVAGFGALAFVSFPVVAAFGLVLGIGLPTAFLAAVATVPAQSSGGVERGASPLGLEMLWLGYRWFGLKALHAFAAAVGIANWLVSAKVRRTVSRRKLVNFTRSLADKLVTMAEGRELPSVRLDESPDAQEFLAAVRAGRGVFVLSSHVGTIEMLVALGECDRTFHAWMDFDRTGVFNRFYLAHVRRPRVVIHPISEFGMGTVFEAGDLIDGGDCLLMAGDRGAGAFRFAAAFEHPVYFIACLLEGDGGYRVKVFRLPPDRRTMERTYGERLAELQRDYPDQWYEW